LGEKRNLLLRSSGFVLCAQKKYLDSFVQFFILLIVILNLNPLLSHTLLHLRRLSLLEGG